MFKTYDILTDKLSKYTGYKYAVLTDCCTHAIELCLRYQKPAFIGVNSKTYLSIPNLAHKLNIGLYFYDEEWQGEYQIKETNIYDSSRLLSKNMHEINTIKRISFGHDKPIDIGRGGAILLDDYTMFKWLDRAKYDGRDLKFKGHWSKDKNLIPGYHYNMSIEQAEQITYQLRLYQEPEIFKGHECYEKYNGDYLNYEIFST